MAYKRLLTIQDISCVGQCSLTVALPILSACGHETAILPSAVLSTHTGGFTGFTFRDLSDDMPAINAHWLKEGLKFEAVYTGYLGSTEQIAYVQDIFNTLLKKGGLTVVDPAMADHGKLYSGFNKIRLMNHRRQENTLNSYTEIRKELEKFGPDRDIVFSICEWGKTQPQNWGHNVGDSWRILNDITFQVGADGNNGTAAWECDYIHYFSVQQSSHHG